MHTLRRNPYLIAAVCAVLYFAPFLTVLSHAGDEGTLVTGASRVMEGQVPLRDFFEVMGPGTFYWLALFFKLFGTTWFATRVCLLVTTTSITILLYYLARRLRPSLGSLSAVFFVAASYHNWNAISHHMDSTLFSLLAFTAFVTWIAHQRRWLLVLAGTSAGLTTWIMLPKGALLCFAFLLTLLILTPDQRTFIRSATLLMGGYLVILTSGIVAYGVAGGLRQLVYANVLWPLTNYRPTNVVPYGLEFKELYWSAFRESFSSSFSPFAATGISAFLCIPLLFALALPLFLIIFALRYRRAAFAHTLLPYWIAGLAIWVSELHRKDISHIVFGSPLLIIIAFYFWQELANRWAARALQLVAVSAVCLALLNPLVALLTRGHTVTRRGALYTMAEDPVLTLLSTHTQPGDPMFVYPYAPMYYFLSATHNPTRHSILMYGINTDSQFRSVVNDLDSQKTPYVLWDRSFPVWINKWFPAYRIPPSDQQIIEPYLLRHYTPIGRAGNGFEFLKRNELLTTEATSVLTSPQEDRK